MGNFVGAGELSSAIRDAEKKKIDASFKVAQKQIDIQYDYMEQSLKNAMSQTTSQSDYQTGSYGVPAHRVIVKKPPDLLPFIVIGFLLYKGF